MGLFRLPVTADDVTNDVPDERALAAYEARARFHASTLALLASTLPGLGQPEHTHLAARIVVLREEARRGLRVMRALAATWRRDIEERQRRSLQWEQELRERYRKFKS